MTTKQLAKITDQRIERVYCLRCTGIEIDIMDIGKVFAHGRTLIGMGATDEELGDGIFSYVCTIRQN